MKLSAVILAKNEARMIGDCLKSITQLADEIIVVDGGSSDETIKIAEKFGAKVVEYKSESFAKRRDKGLDESKGDWILYIDADERITPELSSEIKKILKEPKFEAYAIPRRNFIFGRQFKHSGQFPDYQKRLFAKSKLQGWKGDLHEEPILNGSLGHLSKPMTHLKNMTLNDMVVKTNNWSEVEARLMYEAGHPPVNIPRFVSAITREFWLRMVKQLAFLDGPEGVIYALYQVFSRFVSYAKLWEMQIVKK